jgi:hypothetical protein
MVVDSGIGMTRKEIQASKVVKLQTMAAQTAAAGSETGESGVGRSSGSVGELKLCIGVPMCGSGGGSDRFLTMA